MILRIRKEREERREEKGRKREGSTGDWRSGIFGVEEVAAFV